MSQEPGGWPSDGGTGWTPYAGAAQPPAPEPLRWETPQPVHRPGYGPPTGHHPYGGAGPQPGPPPSLPSRTLTVVITLLFGLFGAIPASVHSRRARRLSAPTNRYWAAFGVTLVAGLVIEVGAVVAVVALVASGDPTFDASARWTPDTIVPIFEQFPDFYDDSGSPVQVDGGTTVEIPCGGRYAHGMSDATVHTVTLSSTLSAQLLTDAGSAAAELDRLRDLAEGCTTDYEFLNVAGDSLGTCQPLVVETTSPALRFEEPCEDFAPIYFAIFQADNAVVAVGAPSEAQLDALLADVRPALGVG